MADGVLGLVRLVAAVCLAVRYVVPVVLLALVGPLCGAVEMFAALLVLPEFWVSTACRRDGGRPPRVAYAYGDGVCRLAGIGHRGVCVVLRSLARAARTLPSAGVAIVVLTWKVGIALP